MNAISPHTIYSFKIIKTETRKKNYKKLYESQIWKYVIGSNLAFSILISYSHLAERVKRFVYDKEVIGQNIRTPKIEH